MSGTPEQENADAQASVAHQLAIMEKAFELATANGLTYQYEGWGGRYKTRSISADEYRKTLLERAQTALAGDQP